MKIYISGIESYRDIVLESGYPNLFVSFFRKNSAGKVIEQANNQREIVVDSGAFSFITQRGFTAARGNLRPEQDDATDPKNIDKYVDSYCEFVEKYKHLVDYFVELDIDEIVGRKKVIEIRERLTAIAGQQIIPVYHPTMGKWKDEWKTMKEYEFIALEGIHAGEKPRFSYAECLHNAYLNGNKIHVFAMTKQNFMRQHPIYSTDSTSWSNIMRFGRSQIVQRKGISAQYYAEKMRRGKNNIKYDIIEEINVWLKLQTEITQLWEMRGVDWEAQIKKVWNQEQST